MNLSNPEMSIEDYEKLQDKGYGDAAYLVESLGYGIAERGTKFALRPQRAMYFAELVGDTVHCSALGGVDQFRVLGVKLVGYNR